MDASKTKKHYRHGKGIEKARRYWFLYLLFLPSLVFLCVFVYWPIILQMILSFKDFSLRGGIWFSEWVGLENFRTIFSKPEIYRVIFNTIKISVIGIIINFFPPIILSILLFDLRFSKLRRVTQNLVYIPYFFSWIVIYAVAFAVFSNSGILNGLLGVLGIPTQNFMVEPKYFISLIMITTLWKNLGWNTIIYMAALTSIDTELFDAAKVDGAGPLARIRYITIPGIRAVAVFVLTLSLGGILSANTEQILLFYTPATYQIGDVIGTWIFRQGLGKLQYSLGAAMSLFQSVIGFTLVITANKLSKKFAKVGIW